MSKRKEDFNRAMLEKHEYTITDVKAKIDQAAREIVDEFALGEFEVDEITVVLTRIFDPYHKATDNAVGKEKNDS